MTAPSAYMCLIFPAAFPPDDHPKRRSKPSAKRSRAMCRRCSIWVKPSRLPARSPKSSPHEAAGQGSGGWRPGTRRASPMLLPRGIFPATRDPANMPNSRESLLQEFVDWSAAHITGDEKGQAQIFLDHLFRAFGQKGSLDVGGTAEMRIRKSDEDGGGTSFADYVWKPVVLIEMKKRGTDLSRHFRQAFDYWVRLVPDRPQYVVLCNFDEFHVYDFNNQIDSPKDKIKLAELAGKWGPLAFLFPTREKPVFGNDREKVTREAADRLALCFRKLIDRNVDRDLAQRFILQTLVALFAEDIGLLPRYLVASLVEQCQEPADSYDKLGGLFEAMNTPTARTSGPYKGVRYFNGGIFAHPAKLELHEDELAQIGGAPARTA